MKGNLHSPTSPDDNVQRVAQRSSRATLAIFWACIMLGLLGGVIVVSYEEAVRSSAILSFAITGLFLPYSIAQVILWREIAKCYGWKAFSPIIFLPIWPWLVVAIAMLAPLVFLSFSTYILLWQERCER